MIKRLVKMEFRPEHTEAFKTIFRTNWTKIKSFEGCQHVELLQDENNPCVFFTYSLWDSEQHLNAYRDSALFAAVWKETRALFSEKAAAWSMKTVLD
ncbi:MAG TPA: antibiotic biosynthesis monooxygenase [Bacteroidia bacterium]|nr:antibiotic biosynthesis monooxygenase [Bacteroidia bacterium]